MRERERESEHRALVRSHYVLDVSRKKSLRVAWRFDWDERAAAGLRFPLRLISLSRALGWDF